MVSRKHSVPCYELDAMILRAEPITESQIRKLTAAGLSKYEPNPFGVLERVEAEKTMPVSVLRTTGAG